MISLTTSQMISFTTNQWAILGLVLVLGWLLGLMSRPGGAQWKRAYEEERKARLAEQGAYEPRQRAARDRIAELEREAPAINPRTAGIIGAAARGERDDLSQIRGIDRDLALRLNESGFYSYRDVARMSRDDEITLEGRLAIERGRITRERWREQAAMLQKGEVEEQRAVHE